MNNIWIISQVIVVFKIHLPIEKGSWLGITRNERVCRLCNANKYTMNFTICFLVRFFKILEENILVMLTVQTQASSLLKKVMSESNLHKLKEVCYCVSAIHKTLAPLTSMSGFVLVLFFLVVFFSFVYVFL